MNSTRRGFLSALAAMFAAPVVAELDPEKLVWVPGAKLISIPKPQLIAKSSGLLRIEDITLEVLMVLKKHMAIERINAEYEKDFNFLSGEQWAAESSTGYRIGDTITVRKPQRFHP